MYNMDKMAKKVKVELDRDIASRLKKMMDVGETYSTVIRRCLEKCQNRGNTDD